MNYKVTEYPNFKILNDRWPTTDQQTEFFREYLSEIKRLNGQEKYEVTSEEISLLKEETEQFSLCAHLLWCLWGITQYGDGEIQFGFLAFAKARIEMYLDNKRKIFGDV